MDTSRLSFKQNFKHIGWRRPWKHIRNISPPSPFYLYQDKNFKMAPMRIIINNQFSSVQSLSRVWLFATPWIAAHQASLSITISWSSLRLMSIESVMPSSHLILGCPLLLLPPTSPSIRVFSNESTLRVRCPKYWSFSFSIIPSKEIPGLISFRMDWLDLPAVQGTLKSLLQHHSSLLYLNFSDVRDLFARFKTSNKKLSIKKLFTLKKGFYFQILK